MKHKKDKRITDRSSNKTAKVAKTAKRASRNNLSPRKSKIDTDMENEIMKLDIGDANLVRTNDVPLKSNNDRKCLTKCYPKGKTYLHPVLLTAIADTVNKSTCAINPAYAKDVPEAFSKLLKNNNKPEQTNYYNLIYVDECNLENNNIYKLPDELESILLSYYFNPNDFVENIYGLHSFVDVIDWTLENDYLPFNTIKRIHNCAWRIYGNKEENLPDQVVEYYYYISKNHWMRDYSRFLLEKSTDIKTIDLYKYDSVDKLTKYINENYYDYNYFTDIMTTYMATRRDNWADIESYYGNLKKYIFGELIIKITE